MKIIITLILGMLCSHLTAGEYAAQGTPSESQLSLTSMLSSALRNARCSGSLEYRGQCVATPSGNAIHEDFNVVFQSGDDRITLDALRATISQETRLSLTEGSDGLIRVSGKEVNPDLLTLKLRHIQFRGESHPMDALSAILSAPEVREFVGKHKMRILPTLSLDLVPYRSGPSPKVFGSLDNVPVSAALDHVLKVFPGLWTYSECVSGREGRLAHFAFIPNE